MKAPDKIYIQQDMINNLILEEKEYADDVEYIHKDALLEWANDNLLECEASNDDADYGRIDAFKKLIDKLNSL